MPTVFERSKADARTTAVAVEGASTEGVASRLRRARTARSRWSVAPRAPLVPLERSRLCCV